MAINPTTAFPGKIAAATPAFPYGKARDVSSPGAGDGTPWVALLLNDVFGFQQALLDAPAVPLVPSGTPDEVGASQYVDALGTFIDEKIAAAPSPSQIPAGATILWHTATAPSGYLELDGSAINRITYADLFAAIGTFYGVGDGATTFDLPDSRGEFLRGWDHGAGNDPDAAGRTDRGDGTTGDNIGTKQADAFESHIHTTNASISSDGNSGSQVMQDNLNNATPVPTNATGGNETRPRNIYVMYCIKY